MKTPVVTADVIVRESAGTLIAHTPPDGLLENDIFWTSLAIDVPPVTTVTVAVTTVGRLVNVAVEATADADKSPKPTLIVAVERFSNENGRPKYSRLPQEVKLECINVLVFPCNGRQCTAVCRTNNKKPCVLIDVEFLCHSLSVKCQDSSALSQQPLIRIALAGCATSSRACNSAANSLVFSPREMHVRQVPLLGNPP